MYNGEDFDTLAGRSTQSFCLPLSIAEIADNAPVFAYDQKVFEQNLMTNLQIFGAYPEVYLASTHQAKIALLQNIFDTYVLKDILTIPLPSFKTNIRRVVSENRKLFFIHFLP